MYALPFPKKSNRSAEVLQIVHSDVCGPVCTESLGVCKYYGTVIDDCTRWYEVWFLKNKSDVFQAFVMTLQSDNGKESCNKDFDR